MHRFQVNASTKTGDTVGLVGSTSELGCWDISRCVKLRTAPDRYPLWWIEPGIQFSPDSKKNAGEKIEYKYIILDSFGNSHWETEGGDNRWIPSENSSCQETIIVSDGWFGEVQTCPYGYFLNPASMFNDSSSCKSAIKQSHGMGIKIVVLGSSVAMGCNAWLLRGWAWRLTMELANRYGHKVVNVSSLGATVDIGIEEFAQKVLPEKPDVVIISFSLGNEGLPYCRPEDMDLIKRRYENGLQRLASMSREIGAMPILGAPYPHQNYSTEHSKIIRNTLKNMNRWGIPVLNWFSAVANKNGKWKKGLLSDAAHPNTEGHRLMYKTINLDLFRMDRN